MNTAFALLALLLLAVVLAALNFALQRTVRPAAGSEADEPIAGCCGMALPEELMHTDDQSTNS